MYEWVLEGVGGEDLVENLAENPAENGNVGVGVLGGRSCEKFCGKSCGPAQSSKNRKLVSAIMKNWKNGSSSPKMRPRAKLPITEPPKVWVYGFQSVIGNGKLASAIMENWKNGSISPKTS